MCEQLIRRVIKKILPKYYYYYLFIAENLFSAGSSGATRQAHKYTYHINIKYTYHTKYQH
jgi:hypothetical protein